MSLPDIVFVAGKKRSGKDYVCDRLVAEAGFHKFHIVYPWLVEFCRRHGVAYEKYEADKAHWRSLVQAEASEARAADPDVLIRAFRGLLPTLPRPLCVTAIRFANEARLGTDIGALVVRVDTPDAVRRERFVAAGESLALMDDPFEREVDTLPVHGEIPGTLAADEIVPHVAALNWRRGSL